MYKTFYLPVEAIDGNTDAISRVSELYGECGVAFTPVPRMRNGNTIGIWFIPQVPFLQEVHRSFADNYFELQKELGIEVN